MTITNDKIGLIKVAQTKTSGDVEADLNNLIYQDKEGLTCLWDLDSEIAPLLAELPLYIQEQIYHNGKALWGFSEHEPRIGWDIFYERGKILCISKDRGENRKFYNLSQYFPNIENPGIELAERCADELEHALHLMGIWSKTLSSPAKIFEEYYGKHLDLPNYKHFGMEYRGLLEYAAECCGKEWVETFKLGYWPECYSYDRINAYGTEMAQLLDNRPTNMRIWDSDEYEPDADFGYCKCVVKINESETLHPIMYVGKNNTVSTHVGIWHTYLTKGYIDFINKWQLGEVEIQHGWWLKVKRNSKPLEIIIPRFLKNKESSNPLVADLTKRMINGFGGKFAEEYADRVGNFYNPMWKAEIEANNAIKVAEVIYRNKCWDDVINIKVDDFKIGKKLPEIPQGWRETQGECLVATADDVFYGNQHPDNWALPEVLKMFREQPNTGYFEKRINKVITLDEAFAAKQPKECGKVKDKVVTLDLFRNNPNRDFEELPLSAYQLLNNKYNSKPIYVEEGFI